MFFASELVAAMDTKEHGRHCNGFVDGTVSGGGRPIEDGANCTIEGAKRTSSRLSGQGLKREKGKCFSLGEVRLSSEKKNV